MSVLINPSTRLTLDAMRTSPPQAILLTGPVGSGLFTLAQHIASEWGSILDIVQPVAATDKGTARITIEVVRTLYERTRSKFTSPHIVIIDDGDSMLLPAQNALLKLLEEPTPYVHFIMCAHRPDGLLPTIRSRLQTVNVGQANSAESVRLLRAHGVSDEAAQRQMLFLAQGLPAELTRLATDKKYFSTISQQTGAARDFLAAKTYDRLAHISRLPGDRRDITTFIDTVLLLTHKTLARNPTDDQLRLVERLLDARAAIGANANARLQLAAAVVQ